MTESELKGYVSDKENGLQKSLQKNGYDIEVTYRPTELVLFQHLDGVEDASERETIKKQIDTLSYFVVKLSRNGQEIEHYLSGNRHMLAKVVSYLSSGIGDDLMVATRRDKMHPLDVAYVRSYGATSGTSLLVVFRKPDMDTTDKLTFVLNDELIGIGSVAFDFQTKDLKRIPTLRLN
jgi:hypothetical protein